MSVSQVLKERRWSVAECEMLQSVLRPIFPKKIGFAATGLHRVLGTKAEVVFSRQDVETFVERAKGVLAALSR